MTLARRLSVYAALITIFIVITVLSIDIFQRGNDVDGDSAYTSNVSTSTLFGLYGKDITARIGLTDKRQLKESFVYPEEGEYMSETEINDTKVGIEKDDAINSPLPTKKEGTPSIPASVKTIADNGSQNNNNGSLLLPESRPSSPTATSFTTTPTPALTPIPTLAPIMATSSNLLSAQTALADSRDGEEKDRIEYQRLSDSELKKIFSSIVKISCKGGENNSRYVGSGFVLKGGLVITAAHLVMQTVGEECRVIFPLNRKPTYFFKATIIEPVEDIAKRHNQQGIDIAFLRLNPITDENRNDSSFTAYPSLDYPICSDPDMLGDKLLHFGYPSNYLDQSYLEYKEGKVLVYADIAGIAESFSEDGTYSFKTPKLISSIDSSRMHPYIVSAASTYYGDSGGLTFNVSKRCILGIQREGTVGREEGNYTFLLNLGWDELKPLLDRFLK